MVDEGLIAALLTEHCPVEALASILPVGVVLTKRDDGRWQVDLGASGPCVGDTLQDALAQTVADALARGLRRA